MIPANENGGPILVTGAPRSGTTFLGRMLGLYHRLTYLDEPFNYQMGVVGLRQQFVYLYEGSPEEQYYLQLVKKLLSGRGNFNRSELTIPPRGTKEWIKRWQTEQRELLNYKLTGLGVVPWRYLLKDPMASFSAEYLHRNFDMPVIVIIRHPAAVVASYRRLGWRFGLSDLTRQQELMKRHLGDILGEVDVHNISDIDEGSLLWMSVYKVLADYASRNPGFVVIRHEDISLNPVAEIRELYAWLKLPFTTWTRMRIQEYTSSNNPSVVPPDVAHSLRRNSKGIAERWHGGLSQAELSRIQELTESVTRRYYPPDSWKI